VGRKNESFVSVIQAAREAIVAQGNPSNPAAAPPAHRDALAALDRILREQDILRFRLAALDMVEARTAAEELVRDYCKLPPGFHALEVGMVVVYTRPFTQSYWIEPLGDDWRPEGEDGELHDWLMFERNKWAAHTDRESGRGVADVSELWTEGESGAPVWRFLEPARVRRVPDLCESQEKRFRDEYDRLEAAAEETRRRHGERFRNVSTRYPHRVAEAYGRDLDRAMADSDEQVAARVAAWEKEQGLDPLDWQAIGAEERGVASDD
jgi:hypothetical protein